MGCGEGLASGKASGDQPLVRASPQGFSAELFPCVSGLKSQGWMGSRGDWVRSSVAMLAVAAFPWEGWLSIQVCWGGGYESVQGPPAGWELAPAEMGACTGPGAGHRSAWEGCRPGPSWLLAHCPPSCDEREGLMHQWSCQRSCLAGCREVRLVFPIRPPAPRQEVSPAQLTLAGSLATEGRPSSVVKKIKWCK